MWHHRVQSTPDAESMIYREGDGWKTITWKEAHARVHAFACGLLSLELKKEERCAILCGTRPEWILADMAILCAAGATTTVYPSNTPQECAYILNDCGAVLAFCEDEVQVSKLREIRKEIPQLKHVIVFDGKASQDGWVQTGKQLEEAGRAFHEKNPEAYEAAHKAITSDQLATLIYTSGTTGKPKGVMLSHDAWVYEAQAIDSIGMISPADRQYLFLPLSHVFAKVMEVIFIRLGVPTVVDGDIDALIDNLSQTHPTWMGAVPRVFEKAYAKIVTGAKEAGGAKYKIFKWAVDVGTQVSALRQQQKEPTGLLKWKYSVADRLVFSKVKERFGGRLRFFISGGAPLAKEIAEFFHACDILILEGYGLSESGAASFCNSPDDFAFGTVGKPIPGCEVKIDETDGEILIRSRGVMQGYYNLKEQSDEVLTEDGWLKTGDIGVLLESGHLKITDRKKNIIVTAGGKNIAPARFENLLKARCPYVSQVVMHGDKRPYCVALVTINDESVGKWALEQGIEVSDYASLAAQPAVKQLIEQAIDKVNQELPSYETVKKIALLPEDLTQENGALTPSMKIKKRVVKERYKEVLDALYDNPAQTV